MRDSLREVKTGTSDFIRSRLLHNDSTFPLHVSYLFHCFQTQEASNMCHSVGHMLQTVSGRNLTAKEFLARLVSRDGELQSRLAFGRSLGISSCFYVTIMTSLMSSVTCKWRTVSLHAQRLQ